jgi:hypothetical protein
MSDEKKLLKTLLLELNQRPISYYPIYAEIGGGVLVGVALSQLLYWNKAVNGRAFYKSDEEIMSETKLSAAEWKTAKKKLKKLPFVKIFLRGVPARTHYEFDLEGLAEAIFEAASQQSRQFGGINQTRLAESDKLDWRNQPNLIGGFNQTITENTTENKAENTTESERKISLEKFTPDYYKKAAKAFLDYHKHNYGEFGNAKYAVAYFENLQSKGFFAKLEIPAKGDAEAWFRFCSKSAAGINKWARNEAKFFPNEQSEQKAVYKKRKERTN